ncbi:uncharacterized protein MELLADRAFT_113189 [Melampsora larici-populina 98AG31]|uniref:Uncharacterized protein n=1 Tax=Melampsora larici-populina (strain 98AG31 / pathotype 3-4-7) TaxID=747676 RepID=F4S923_MELLP|nr:uncharacterized protein MELLADRAFT_113189 [Melampsora larici-populina 98AG31]EGF98861.1 hypothetical protein MELLADRAFT_113189 [Melampsora larici-populina 98AG31]
MPVTAMAEVKDGLDQCFTCSLYGHAFANCPIKGTKPRKAFNDWRLVDNGKMYSVLALWPHLALERARSGSPIYKDASSDSVVNLNDKEYVINSLLDSFLPINTVHFTTMLYSGQCVKGNAQTLGAEMSNDAPKESLNVTVVQETCPDTTKPIGDNGECNDQKFKIGEGTHWCSKIVVDERQ